MAAWCPLLSTNFKWICNPNIWNSIFASEGFTISESAPLGVCRAMASGRTRTEHFIFYKWKAGDTFWCTKFFIEVCLIIDFACLRTALLLILLLPDGWLILPPFSVSQHKRGFPLDRVGCFLNLSESSCHCRAQWGLPLLALLGARRGTLFWKRRPESNQRFDEL